MTTPFAPEPIIESVTTTEPPFTPSQPRAMIQGEVDLLKLGKKARRVDPRTLPYSRYMTKLSLSNIPAAVNWNPRNINFGLLGNGDAGDCVEAQFCNYLGYVGLDAGHPFSPTPANATGAYSAITGYNSSNPDSDRGTDMMTANNYWRKTGIAGHKLFCFTGLNITDTIQLRHAVALTGPTSIGIQLPLSAQAQTGPGQLWTVAKGSESVAGSWGGHCVAVTGYTLHYVQIETWGFTQLLDWNFFLTYVDEGYAFLSTPWIKKSGFSPSGLHWGALLADMASL
jgi:hypothetical protein